MKSQFISPKPAACLILTKLWNVIARRVLARGRAFSAARVALLLLGWGSQPEAQAQAASGSASEKLLILRNIPSWNRNPDFEEASKVLGLAFDVKDSSKMKSVRMADYRVIVIPGAQWNTEFYRDFALAADVFEAYVQGGGVLVFELNGAENDGITLPGGASMVPHEGTDNVIVMPNHPAVAPLGKRPRITANLASHGYLKGVPANALVLMTVMNPGDEKSDTSKPTYVEYARGKGRVIAACQCFHDQDRSGRGPLMPAVLAYAMAGKWHQANPAKVP